MSVTTLVHTHVVIDHGPRNTPVSVVVEQLTLSSNVTTTHSAIQGMESSQYKIQAMAKYRGCIGANMGGFRDSILKGIRNRAQMSAFR